MMSRSSRVLVLVYLTNPILSFEPWSCEKQDYLPLPDLNVGHEIMVTEQGINEAYCTKIVGIDSEKKKIELENGAVFKFANSKAKMGGSMNCDMQCSMNKMQQQMNQQMQQMMRMSSSSSFSKSMSWNRKSSWSKSGSSRRTATRKAQNMKNSARKQSNNVNVDGSLPGSDKNCDSCEIKTNSKATAQSNANYNNQQGTIQVDLEIGVNGNSKKVNINENLGDTPGIINIQANAEVNSQNPQGNIDIKVERKKGTIKKYSKRRQYRKKTSNKSNGNNCVMGMNCGNNMGSNMQMNMGSNFGSNMQMNFGSNFGSNMGSNFGSNMRFGNGMNMQMNMGSNFGSSMGSNMGFNMGSNMQMNFGSSFGGSNMGSSSMCMSGSFNFNGNCKKKLAETDCCKLFGKDNTCMENN